MKYICSLFFVLILMSSCSRLDELKWDKTPGQWLDTHSYSEVNLFSHNIVISEPSSSIIVFLLGIFLVVVSIKMLKNTNGEKSRKYWGFGLFFWGISTFPAGISYQAFSYILKYQGRDIALWTTWWEIWYLILFVLSMNLIVAGVAYSSSKNKTRKAILTYATLNSIIYTTIALVGAFIPNQFMVSFECMILFVGPTYLFLLIYNLIQYSKDKDILDKKLANAWLLMFLVTAVYFVVLMSTLPATLWSNGIWFNANDTLHVGLILWIVYYMVSVEKRIKDKQI